jgi:hypothetical protein
MGSLQSPNTATLTHVDESDYPSPIGNVPSEVLSHIFVLCSCDYSVPLLYRRWDVPHQVTISHVCSRWRQVALSTGALWSNVRISEFQSKYTHCLFLYQTWVGRACDYPLTLTLTFSGSGSNLYKFFLDFVVPFRIKVLHMTLPSDRLFDLPPLDVEEFAIDVTNFLMGGDSRIPPFMERTRRICIWSLGLRSVPSAFGERIKALSLSWHQLRSFECHSHLVSLSTWLDILHQAQTLQSLERCRLTISEVGSGPLIGVCMPNLRWFALSLLGPIHPDSAIPLFAAPNITTLGISSPDHWSSNTYDIIARHYKLHQLQHIWIHAAQFPLRIAQILTDAPMIHNLKVLGKPVLDAETQKDIASGRLGRCLTSLHINGCLDSAEQWLDMIRSRQMNVNSMITHVSNWRELFTGIKSVEFWDVYNTRGHKERVAALEALGITIRLR